MGFLRPPQYSSHLSLTSHLSSRKRTSLLKAGSVLLLLLAFFPSVFLSASAAEETETSSSEEVISTKSDAGYTPQRSLLFGEGEEPPDAKLPELPCFRLRRPGEENQRDASEKSAPRHPLSHAEKEETADGERKAELIASRGVPGAAGGLDVEEDADEGELSSGGFHQKSSSTRSPGSRNETYVSVLLSSSHDNE